MDIAEVPGVAGALLFSSPPHADERGFFCRTLDADALGRAGLDPDAFVQDSVSRSARGVIRGMHVRRPPGEAKLVRCSYGAVLDVLVDLRPDSPTYLGRATVELRDDPPRTLYVPAGCAHGFQALTGPADVTYRIDRRHDPAADLAIAYDDPELAIPWPIPATIVSSRDRAAPPLSAVLAAMTERP